MAVGALKISVWVLAASEGEPSKVPFYIAGGVLAGWAVLVSVLGLRQADFPRTPGAARLVMAISAVLVLAAASMAVATAGKAKRTGRTPSPPGRAAPTASAPAGAAPATSPPPGAASSGVTGAGASGHRSAPRAGSGAGGVSGASGNHASGAPTSLALSADPAGQLRYDHSSLRTKAGRVTIRFSNHSPVAHNVTIEASGRLVAASATVTGSTTSVSAALKPGTYTFYCSVDSHRQAGMQGTLTVG